jgi:hypothetical protein
MMVVLRLEITMEYPWNSIDRGKKGNGGRESYPIFAAPEI